MLFGRRRTWVEFLGAGQSFLSGHTASIVQEKHEQNALVRYTRKFYSCFSPPIIINLRLLAA